MKAQGGEDSGVAPRSTDGRYKADGRYRMGWSDWRGVPDDVRKSYESPDKPEPPITNWDPDNFLNRHGREIGEWCRENWIWPLLLVIWLPVLWKIFR